MCFGCFWVRWVLRGVFLLVLGAFGCFGCVWVALGAPSNFSVLVALEALILTCFGQSCDLTLVWDGPMFGVQLWVLMGALDAAGFCWFLPVPARHCWLLVVAVCCCWLLFVAAACFRCSLPFSTGFCWFIVISVAFCCLLLNGFGSCWLLLVAASFC